MPSAELHVVTGAFGYTGKYIARRLLARGEQVRTLTGHPDRPHPFGSQVSVAPFNFDHPRQLAASLRGAAVLYNTYWIRFPHRGITFEQAVDNTRTLLRAAEEAGVRRIVHLSITNPSEDSSLPYFRGKALLERDIAHSRLSYAIIRPAVIFGREDILINNIAWLLRRLPVFAVFGSGEYRLQPIFVEDLAELAVAAGAEDENAVLDAVGPETFTFNDLVRLIANQIGSRAKLIHVRPGLALFLARLAGYMVGDVLITPHEVQGLMSNLLVSDSPPAGQTRFSEWLAQNAAHVGAKYASELKRHYR